MKAYHIVGWTRLYELTDKGRPAPEDHPPDELRKTPIPYIRYKDNGLLLSPSYRRLTKHAYRLGVMMEMACYGLYWKLVDIARDKTRDYRGWILDENNFPLNPEQVADVLEINDQLYIRKAFDLLVYLGKLEFLEVPAYFPTPPHSAQQRENAGTFQDVTETEVNKNIIKRKDLPEEYPWEPEVASPSPDPPSDKDSVRDSGDTVSVTVSVPTGGPGREKEMEKARQIFLLELTGIIIWHNQSDRTTLTDIAEQLAYRQTYETELPLFNEAIVKARGCARIGNNPLAMFVSAMKKSPFCYIPKGTSYIRAAKDKYHV